MKNKPSLLDIEAFNNKRIEELEQEPSMLEEDSNVFNIEEPTKWESEIINMIKYQKSEIEIISHELTRVAEQLKAHERLLDEQEKEIASLKGEQDSSTNREEENKKVREADLSYNKELILRNIVMLIEEKGFSCNDVARLFKLEGFLPPSPYANWNDKVVEKLLC